jgi:hypothetical protein
MANKTVGLGRFTAAAAARPAAAQSPEDGTSPRRRRGQGETVALTVRLTRPQWEHMHQLALQEGTSLQDIAVEGIAGKFAERGLEF